jgi:hypothetical protein
MEDCEPCEEPDCSGGRRECPGCSTYYERLVCDAVKRGGAAEAGLRMRYELRPPAPEERTVLDAAVRMSRAGCSTDVLDLLASHCRVTPETWRGLGRGAVADDKRAFSHACGKMCLHGLARWEPDRFRALNARLKTARREARDEKKLQAQAGARGADTYLDRDDLGVEEVGMHATAKAVRQQAAERPAEAALEVCRGASVRAAAVQVQCARVTREFAHVHQARGS